MTDAVTQEDRMWDVHCAVSWRQWWTPYVWVTFGRYWRIGGGIGPFFWSIGYVELF